MFLAADDRAEFMRESGHPLFEASEDDRPSEVMVLFKLEELRDCEGYRDLLLTLGPETHYI